MSEVPQLDSIWFISQIFWFSVFFAVNFLMHYFLIIPFLRTSAIELKNKKRELEDKIKEIDAFSISSENKISELELDQKNLISDMYLRSEDEANQEFISKMHHLRSNLTKEKQNLRYVFLEKKDLFMKDFSAAMPDIIKIISDKMRGGGNGRAI